MDKKAFDRLEEIFAQARKLLGKDPGSTSAVGHVPRVPKYGIKDGNTITVPGGHNPGVPILGTVTPANGVPTPVAVSGRASIVFDRTKKNAGALTREQIVDAINRADNQAKAAVPTVKKPSDAYKYAHLFVAVELDSADYGMPIVKTIGRVTLAMERIGDEHGHFNTVRVAVAFCSDKDQYVRKVGRQISSGRLGKGSDFEFIASSNEKAGSITEQARAALEDWLEECRECPRWISKQLDRGNPIMALFPSEL